MFSSIMITCLTCLAWLVWPPDSSSYQFFFWKLFEISANVKSMHWFERIVKKRILDGKKLIIMQSINRLHNIDINLGGNFKCDFLISFSLYNLAYVNCCTMNINRL